MTKTLLLGNVQTITQWDIALKCWKENPANVDIYLQQKCLSKMKTK
jgi:hypothetical protein